jgi:HD-GYP domain-containing protein (c-di-GMP phosphodiesterase class II)
MKNEQRTIKNRIGRPFSLLPAVSEIPSRGAEKCYGCTGITIVLHCAKMEPRVGRAQVTLQRAGDDENLSWHADQRLRIGRLPSCDIVLDDASISRQHAEILYSENGWVVRDLGSTNGTLLNGTRLGRIAQRLHLGDHLQPGRILLTVTQLDDDASADAEFSQTAGHGTAECAIFDPDGTVASDAQPSVPIAVNASDDPLREFLATSLRGAVRALSAITGTVFLAEAHAKKLVRKAVYRMSAAHPASPPDPKLIQRCFQEASPLLVTTGDESDAAGAAPRSLLCLCLRSGKKPLGVLALERAAAHPFGDRELLLGEAIVCTLSAGVVSAQQMLEQQRAMFIRTMLTLAQAVDCRDPYTAGHTQRVTNYVLMLAEEAQVSTADFHHLQIGTPLHDIGKIGIDDAILRKPGRLTPAEFAEIQSHPVKGVLLLKAIPELDPVLPIVGSHHEHWDGSGYPDGLIGEIIPPLARMVTVADVFDALTSDRPYRKALSPEEAFAYLHHNAGTLFDPGYTQIFMRLRARLERLVRERSSVSPTVSKRDLEQMQQTAQAAGVARPRRPA